MTGLTITRNTGGGPELPALIVGAWKPAALHGRHNDDISVDEVERIGI